MAGADELAGRLTDKLGPLPVWAWGGVAGAALLVASLVRKRKAAEPVTPEPAAEGADAAPSPVGGAIGPYSNTSGVWSGNMAPGGTYTPGGDDPAADGYADNLAWSRAAVQWLIHERDVAPLTAVSAIDAYLFGKPLTPAQVPLVEAAIGELGPPPLSPGPVQYAPASPTPNEPKPTDQNGGTIGDPNIGTSLATGAEAAPQNTAGASA